MCVPSLSDAVTIYVGGRRVLISDEWTGKDDGTDDDGTVLYSRMRAKKHWEIGANGNECRIQKKPATKREKHGNVWSGERISCCTVMFCSVLQQHWRERERELLRLCAGWQKEKLLRKKEKERVCALGNTARQQCVDLKIAQIDRLTKRERKKKKKESEKVKGQVAMCDGVWTAQTRKRGATDLLKES